MKVITITWVLCACACLVTADIAHLKSAKARFISKLARAKHHKRGVHSAIPSFKLGYDIPHVHHSVAKPFLLTYPPTAVPVTVKVPLTNPLVHRWPVPVGHRVPVPHPHFGLKFPHKTFSPPKTDQHFHHHHHHIAKPVVPVVPATPIIPVAQPTIPEPVPAPPPVFVQPAPFVPAQPLPAPHPPVQVLPPHLHLKPILPSPVSIPAPVPVHAPVFPSPLIPYAPQYNYVIRPGNAVQTSVFATYPRYPLVNYQTPILPVAQPAPVSQFFLDRPAQLPHYHLYQQAEAHGLVEQQPTPFTVQPTPTHLHPTHLEPQIPVQPTQASVHLDHNGWAPVQPTAQNLAAHHFIQEQNHQIAQEQAQHFLHEQSHHEQEHAHHHVTQEQVPQVYEHHVTEDQQYHELQHQLQQHIQHQAEYEQHLNNQHQLQQDYGPPQEQQINQEYGSPQQEYQGQEYQSAQEYGAPQQQQYQEYGAPQNLGQEYGVPQQGFEGRSSESEGEEQKYHNHIPLGLQLPIDKPQEPFR